MYDDTTDTPTENNFIQFIKRTPSTDIVADDFGRKQRKLNRRLNDIKRGHEPKPLTGKNSLNSDGIEVLSFYSLKQVSFGLTENECLDTYRKKTIKFADLKSQSINDDHFEVTV
jgi:hypothetical protein